VVTALWLGDEVVESTPMSTPTSRSRNRRSRRPSQDSCHPDDMDRTTRGSRCWKGLI